MFTGIIVESGLVFSLTRSEGGATAALVVEAPNVAGAVRTGDSIAVNGVCLTAEQTPGPENLLRFHLLGETLARTDLGDLREGSRVNLEPALAVGQRMGGHFVQGHVDGTGTVRSITERGTDRRLEVAFPIGFGQYLVEKGSIAVAGVSLTVAELGVETFAVWLIPHTWNATNLHERGVGDRVNLEFDILAKQVERLLRFRNLG